MGGLIKNEMIKLSKQTSYRIMTVILAAIIILTPVFNFLFPLLFTFSYDPSDEIGFYLDEADCYEEGSIERQYYLDCVEPVEFFLDEDGKVDWKYDFYIYEYEDLYMKVKAYEYIENGKFGREEILDSNYSIYLDVDNDAPLNALTAKLTELENEIATISFSDYVKAEKELYEQNAAAIDLELLALYDQRALLSEDNPKLNYEIEAKEAELDATNDLIGAYELIVDSVEEPDDWHYQTVGIMKNSIMSLSSVVMPKELFDESEESYFYGGDYDEYVRQTKSDRRIAYEATEIFKHSLKTDIPVSGIESASKSNFRASITSIMGILLIATVIMFGLTLSSEFSSGTVRLLLIRPKTRAKILTSKIIAILIYIGLVSVFAVAVTFVLGTVFGFGFGDMLVPDIIMIGETAVALPSIIMHGVVLLEGLITVIFFGMLALLISVIVKKAALSIALPIVLNSIGATVQSISLLVASYSGLGTLTALLPTSYIDLTLFNMTAAEYYASMYGGNLLAIFGGGMYYEVMPQMFPILGVIYYLIFIAAFTVLSYVVFKRTQIKS